MKVSAGITLVMALIFATLCLGYSGYGWWELSAMPAGAERDDAQGFVWFWVFMGVIGLVSAYISWRMVRSDEV